MSEWTISTLKEHVDQRFEDQDKAVQIALTEREKAVVKAETAADKRFELLNELRQGVATKEQIEALEKVIGVTNSRLDIIDGSTKGSQQNKDSNGRLIGGIAGILGIIGIVSAWIFR